MICTADQMSLDWSNQGNYVVEGGDCSTHGREEKYIQGCSW
jgi:hypothetical protein